MTAAYKKIGEVAAWSALFIAFTAVVAGGAFNRVDTAAADAFAALANPFADRVFSAARSIGDMNNCKLLAAAMALYAFFKRWNRLAVPLIIAFALLFWAGNALKKAVGKERPPAAYARERYIPVSSKSFSYPSGHTSKSAFLFFTMAFLARKSALSKRAREIAIGICYSFIIFVGVASVYVGAHWLSDIIGASILGYAFFLGTAVLADKENA